jgi:RHS repeat-associated protein
MVHSRIRPRICWSVGRDKQRGLGNQFNIPQDRDSGTDGVPDTVATASRYQNWTLDVMGNWDLVTANTGTDDRSHDRQNQITSISGQTTPVYDANGNTIGDETGKTLAYDAWNRLVFVTGSPGVTHAYDALGRRVKESRGASVTDLYYSSGWQALETRNSTTKTQFVWNPGYVDSMVLRDRDAGGDGVFEQRLYVQQDANFNITSISDDTGTVVERYAYDPYGAVTYLDANWGALGTSAYGWVYLHQGGRYDSTGGLYHFRNRELSPTLGRWMQNDPLRHDGGDTNLYRYVGNNAIARLDVAGLRAIEVRMGAFINQRTGMWMKEPIPGSRWFFEGDGRDFGESFENSRIRSWFSIDSKDIGNVKEVNVKHKAGVSRRRTIIDHPGKRFWDYQEKVTTVTKSSSFQNGTNGKCSTRVTVEASGNYPFAEISPDIDYKFLIYFIITDRDTIVTKVGYNHNSFPDYEVLIDGRIAHKHATKDPGPGMWNLRYGPNVKGVKDGPAIHAETCCAV